MASRTRAGHSGEGGRGAREKKARPASWWTQADLDYARELAARYARDKAAGAFDAPATPPALRVEEKSRPHESPPVAIEPPRVTPPRVEPRDHDVERIVSDPHPGYRWI
jgi:hypothetical protein